MDDFIQTKANFHECAAPIFSTWQTYGSHSVEATGIFAQGFQSRIYPFCQMFDGVSRPRMSKCRYLIFSRSPKRGDTTTKTYVGFPNYEQDYVKVNFIIATFL